VKKQTRQSRRNSKADEDDNRKIKMQHGELMKQVEDWDMPDDIMKPIMAIDKILKNNK
jgi:hypothetical protein